MFQQFSQTSFSVPGQTGLMERFYCIAIGRYPLLKTLAFVTNDDR